MPPYFVADKSHLAPKPTKQFFMNPQHKDDDSNTLNSFNQSLCFLIPDHSALALIQTLQNLYLDRPLRQKILHDCVIPMQAAAKKAILAEKRRNPPLRLSARQIRYLEPAERLVTLLMREALHQMTDLYMANEMSLMDYSVCADYLFRQCIFLMAEPVIKCRPLMETLVHIVLPRSEFFSVCGQDVLQEALVDFTQQVNTGAYVPRKAGVATYLARLISRHGSRQIRSRQRLLRRQYRFQEKTGQDTTRGFEPDDSMNQLELYLQHLPPTDKKILYMFAFGYKYAEIASELGAHVQAEAVGVRARRLIARLRIQLEGHLNFETPD
jgi:RNA polymerase sigma factor (sigma-70 family)